MDVGGLDFPGTDLRGGNHAILDLGRTDGGITNLGTGDSSVLNLRHTNRAFCDLRPDNSRILYLGCSDGGVSDLRVGNRRVLNVGGLNRCHLNLDRADRARLQSACAYGVNSQLAPGDNTAGQLSRGDGIALHRIGHRAQGHAGVLLRQAVVGILGHTHGHLYPDSGRDDPHSVPQVDVLQEAVLLVLFSFRAVDEIHVQRDGRCITPCVILCLHGFPHIGIALFLCLGIVTVRFFLGIRHRQMNPFRVGISLDKRTVDEQFREVQHVSVRVLACGHNAGDHIGQVNVIADAQQVFRLPDLHVAVLAHALHQKHIPPVPRELALVFLHHTTFTQQGVHGIDVHKLHVLRPAVQVGIEGEIMLR